MELLSLEIAHGAYTLHKGDTKSRFIPIGLMSLLIKLSVQLRFQIILDIPLQEVVYIREELILSTGSFFSEVRLWI